MCSLDRLFANNRSWGARRRWEDPEFFTRLARQQSPRYLWIGCSDSRVSANEILGKHGVAESLQESLVWPSSTLVASLRVGLAAAMAASVGAALDLERAYWIVAAAVLIVHQGWDWNRSVQRGFERIIGTLLGLALAVAVLWIAPQGL